jgi:hypothetical protein
VPASFRSADRDAAASGGGVFNGIGNIVGALSPVAIGALILLRAANLALQGRV